MPRTPLEAFDNIHMGQNAVPRLAFPVTPADNTIVQDTDGNERVLRRLYVAVGGDIEVTLLDMQDKRDGTVTNKKVVYAGFPDASYLEAAILIVHATNTTATGLIGEV